jgi:cyclopropane-fatty-acyl-phospholipid synthase
MATAAKIIYCLLERGAFPDRVIRFGIRSLLAKKLSEERKGGPEAAARRLDALVAELKRSPIAVHTLAANEQHYELPTSFFQIVLGKRLKYSGGLWAPGADLDASEEAMLALTCERAGLEDGQNVLELGCGWGSLSLFMAERYPKSHITAVSNSRTQKKHIDAVAAAACLTNLRVVTADVTHFETTESFDRAVSVEMFEHMRNYQKLFAKVASFLKPDGKLFVHVFAHRDYAYLYDDSDPADWMARYFFTGGTMPNDGLFARFPDALAVEKTWKVDGTHYQKTCEAWLKRMDARKAEVEAIFRETYGKDAKKWIVYWRVFFMACAELFGYDRGREWAVCHYLFRKAA